MKRLFASTNGNTIGNGETVTMVLVGYHKESPLNYPVACTDSKRVSVGLFRRCKVARNHLHEHCKACGFRWLTLFAGDS